MTSLVRYMPFTVGEQRYALPMEAVRVVHRLPQGTNGTSSSNGSAPSNGTPSDDPKLTLGDMRVLFGSSAEEHNAAYVIFIASGDVTCGLIVDGVAALQEAEQLPLPYALKVCDVPFSGVIVDAEMSQVMPVVDTGQLIAYLSEVAPAVLREVSA